MMCGSLPGAGNHKKAAAAHLEEVHFAPPDIPAAKAVIERAGIERQ
jgi:hypothetical protein